MSLQAENVVMADGFTRLNGLTDERKRRAGDGDRLIGADGRPIGRHGRVGAGRDPENDDECRARTGATRYSGGLLVHDSAWFSCCPAGECFLFDEHHVRLRLRDASYRLVCQVPLVPEHHRSAEWRRSG